MIISHKHRFIFFAIPKTGTHSVRQALRAHLGPDDLEQVALLENKRFPFPELADIGHGHISAQEIRPVLGDEIYDSYFKFAFVRNPFDRFVSYCAFISRETGHFANNAQAFMTHIVAERRPLQHILYRPQSEFVTDATKSLAVDFIGRNESMQESYDAICERVGIPSTALGRVNSSTRRSYRDYYTPRLIELVQAQYQDDLNLFEYEFERDSQTP
jgi:hypothetical protein